MRSSSGRRRRAGMASGWRAPVVLVVATMTTSTMMAGCRSEEPVDGMARSTAAFDLIVDAVADSEFDPVGEGEPLPVVYVTGRDDVVPFDVQVAVAAARLDQIDVRFADTRTEAIDDGLEGLPVRESGILVVVGPVPETGRRFEVAVEVYRTALQTESGRAVVRWRDGQWTLDGLEFDTE